MHYPQQGPAMYSRGPAPYSHGPATYSPGPAMHSHRPTTLPYYGHDGFHRGAGGGAAGAGLGCGAGCAACGCTYTGATEMDFVGHGRGSYTTEITYRYVGGGSGDFTYIRPKATFFGLVCCGCFAVVAVIFLLFFFIKPGTTTTTLAPIGPPRPCFIWGDPHVETFDHAFPSFYDEGEFWVVKSKMVSIQGRYLATPFTHGLSSMHAIAIGGPFLAGHTIIVGPMENGQILVDGRPALYNFPSSESVAGMATLRYDAIGEVVDSAMRGMERHIVHMELPLGVQVQVMRWANHINVKIVMAPRVGGQDGHCGNHNGDPADDSAEAIEARIGGPVPPDECLFHHTTPVRPSPRHSLDECRMQDPVKYQLALRTCQAQEESLGYNQVQKDCVFDVCFAGEQYAGEDALENA